jgi:murein DD-endopeptidase MepM/ murein hydrolase activator NlpD
MQRIFRLLFIITLVTFSFNVIIAQDALPTPVPVPTIPAPSRIVPGNIAEIGLYFDFIKQGRVGLLRVSGADVAETQASIFDTRLNFFTVPDDPAHYAVIVAPINQSIKSYELKISVANSKQETEQFSLAVAVENGDFIQQDVILTGEKAYLVDQTIEDNELAHIFRLVEPVTEERLWDSAGFHVPVQAPLTSQFGAVRVFNGFLRTLHTGWDFQVPLGKPVVAAASGEVAFAGAMDIRGNYVLINHGYGIYSGYAHLSVVYVTQGQPVRAGQIIGQVGTTGRSSSPHAHFEMLVNGNWVDSADFLRTYIP